MLSLSEVKEKTPMVISDVAKRSFPHISSCSVKAVNESYQSHNSEENVASQQQKQLDSLLALACNA